jgi:hypothetical protein
MRIIETKVYGIEEHPNKKLCYAWIRENWHDLNSHSVNEVVDSLTALNKEIGGTFDYSISAVPDRGEFIRFNDYDHDLLCRISADSFTLTGVCWDRDVVEGLRTYKPELVLENLHAETEFIYSDQGLLETCIANEYEFDEDGNFVS